MKESFVLIIIGMLVCCLSSVHAGYYEDMYNAYKAKNYDEAINIGEEGIAAAPNDEQIMLLLGQTYFKVKKYDIALDRLKKAVSLAPEMDTTHYLLGLCYTLQRENGKPKPAWFEASQAFAEASKLKPDKFAYLYNYGHSLMELKKFQQALDPLQQALQTEKGAGDYKTAMELGLALHKTGDKDGAIEMLEKAHTIDPKEHLPLYYLGTLYMDQEDYSKVTAIGDKLIAIKPDFSSGYTFKGFGQLQTKNYSSASQTFKEAIKLDPKDAYAHYYLGLSMESTKGSSAGSYRDLIDTYAKAINLQKGEAPAEWHYRLGHAYELEAMLDWPRMERNTESRVRCKANLIKAKNEYESAAGNTSAQRQLATVNERLARIKTIE